MQWWGSRKALNQRKSVSGIRTWELILLKIRLRVEISTYHVIFNGLAKHALTRNWHTPVITKGPWGRFHQDFSLSQPKTKTPRVQIDSMITKKMSQTRFPLVADEITGFGKIQGIIKEYFEIISFRECSILFPRWWASTNDTETFARSTGIYWSCHHR